MSPNLTPEVERERSGFLRRLAEELRSNANDVGAASPASVEQRADQFAAHLIWMDVESMLPERRYRARVAGAAATVQITSLAYRLEADTHERLASKTLDSGHIGYCKIALDRDVDFDAGGDERNRAFVLFGPDGETVVGAGVLDFALWRASNLTWHAMKIDKRARAGTKQQQPSVLWFTGLSSSGKSTIADRLEQKLHAMGKHTYLMDGDNVRHGLNKDLGFTDEDRVENIRRVAEVAKLMADAGLIVLVSFISPFRSERRMARAMMEDGEFIEIFVDAPLDVCEARDPKGLYRKARAGQLKNFTGIDSDYEPPANAEIALRNVDVDVDILADQVIAFLDRGERI